MNNIAVLDLTKAPLMTLTDVGVLLRVESLARRAVKAGWLVPCARSNEGGSSSPLYSRRAVDALVARIVAGEVPPPIQKERGKEEA